MSLFLVLSTEAMAADKALITVTLEEIPDLRTVTFFQNLGPIASGNLFSSVKNAPSPTTPKTQNILPSNDPMMQDIPPDELSKVPQLMRYTLSGDCTTWGVARSDAPFVLV
jgi:hypothetical protein